MLVLSRKFDEAILISGGIEIRVLKIGETDVKLGFTAPPEVLISRAELGPPRPQPVPA
jgi:carbon storage regulator CsrA